MIILKKRPTLYYLIFFILLASCVPKSDVESAAPSSSQPIISTPPAPVVKNPGPVPSLAEQMSSQLVSEYRIQPGEELEIKLLDHPEYNEKVLVRPDGRISVQFAHEIMAAGKTPAELTDELKKQYDLELKHPRITIILRTFIPQTVYIGGEVKHPKEIVMKGRTSVLQAVIQAGGFLETARTDEVVLIRRQEGDKPVVLPLDITKVIDGTAMHLDMLLKPHDIVFVPRSHIADLNLYIEQNIRRLLPIRTNVNLSHKMSPKEIEQVIRTMMQNTLAPEQK